MSLLTITMTLGGIGLLLLGMNMMTEGLKSAAGSSLQGILERSTRTRMRAAFAGFTITALVQSSSAVIMTTLGFTNAGMLRLKQAAWVVFGSNLGTTVTAWIVALIGLKIRVDVIALPLIGLGMMLRLFLKSERAPHIGFALAGFGVLFLGLGVLRDAFIDVAEVIPVEQLGATGPFGIIAAVLVGALLTALMQSSSASIAIILTASVTGVFSPLVGASLVIGANLGTTVTSLLASVGATANAKRLALVHLTEKAFTGVIALILLAPMWWVASTLAGGDGRTNISAGLALFHTLFNVLGLVLMWFLADHLLRRVERWVKQPELTSGKPRYLDDTVLGVPSMGVGALHSEVKRVFKQLLTRGRRLLTPQDTEPTEDDDMNMSELLKAINEFSGKLGKTSGMHEASENFLNLNWALQESTQLRELLHEADDLPIETVRTAIQPELEEAIAPFFRSGQLKAMSFAERENQLDTIKALRKQRRSELLQQVKDENLTAPEVTQYLQIIALFEESAKRIVRIASVIYPEAEADSEAVPEQEPEQ